MSWQNRLQPTIKLTSPKGNVFTPSWQGDPRNMGKKLGIFEFPKIKGLRIQDLDVGGIRYPLTLLFVGDDNDLEADRFFMACKERGLWSVVHPVRNLLKLQLVSVSEEIQPVTSGNITQIDTEWLEPQETTKKLLLPWIEQFVSAQSVIANTAASEQATEGIVQETFGLTKKIATETEKIVQVINNGLKSITEPIAEINSLISGIHRSITSTLSEITINIAELGGEIQQLVQLPVLATEDIIERINAYSSLILEIFTLIPPGSEPEDKNNILLLELVLSGIIVAVSQSAVSGILETRAQAVQTIENISSLFNDIINNLDDGQENFQTQTIDFQYFSQSQSFIDSVRIITLAFQYLQLSIFDLAIEKRFNLEAPRAPIEITITEYGELGENDINFDNFITSNKLKGNEILILPSGREVVVYV